MEWEDGIDDIQLSQHCDMVEMDYFINNVSHDTESNFRATRSRYYGPNFWYSVSDYDESIGKTEQLKQEPIDADSDHRFGKPMNKADLHQLCIDQ